MKAGRVMNLLGIGRTTLRRWREEGKLKATLLDTGHFEWDDESVYEILNGGSERGIYLYARSCNDKTQIETQLSILRKFAKNNNYIIKEEITDISDGLSLSGTGIRKLFKLVKELKVSAVIITYKDRISRTSFEFLRYIFALFGTEIIVLSNLHDEKVDVSDYEFELKNFENFFQKENFLINKNNESDERTGLSG